MEVLAAVITAVGQAGAVESRVGSVHLLFGVALHKQVDGHHTCALGPASGKSGVGGGESKIKSDGAFGDLVT